MRDNPEVGELNPAVFVRRRCKKNSSVLSCIGQKKAVTVAAKSEQLTAGKTGRASSSEETRRNLVEERIVRKISPSGCIAGVMFILGLI